MIAAKLDEVMFKFWENGFEGCDGGLLGRVRLSELRMVGPVAGHVFYGRITLVIVNLVFCEVLGNVKPVSLEERGITYPPRQVT